MFIGKITKKRINGFSYLELLIVIGIVIMTAVFSVPLSVNWQKNMQLTDSASNIKSQIDLARSRSLTGLNNSLHGVYFGSGVSEIIIFQGASYSERDPQYDRVMELPSSVLFQTNFDDQEVIFEKNTGIASATGTIVMSDTDYSNSLELAVNYLGLATIGQ